MLPAPSGKVAAQIDAGGSAERQLGSRYRRTAASGPSLDGEALGQLSQPAPERSTTLGRTGADTVFAVGAGDGELTVSPGGHRGWWLVLQALLWLAVVVLATPSMAPTAGDR